jgi:hypothetical protein
VGPIQEVQDRTSKIRQLPAAFHADDYDATRNTDQLRNLDPYLLLVQLCHPSPPPQLVGQVQLCVDYFVLTLWAIPEFLMHLG